MNSRRIDQTMLLIGVVLIIISAYKLFWSTTDSADELALGEISAKSSVVKSKGVRGLDWKDALLHEPVSHNQLIYTDARSWARVSLKTGTVIDVQENSLIRIKEEASLESIDLERGYLNTRLAGRPLLLKIGGQEVELNSENALVQISKSKGAGSIGVLSGEVELRKNGATQKVDSRQLIVVDEDEINVKEISFDLQSPKRDEKFYLSGNETKIQFRWEPDSDGKVILINSEGDVVPVQSRVASLMEGNYRWKVSSDFGYSLEQPFSIIDVKSPEILRPLSGEVLRLVPEEGRVSTIFLQWIDSSYPVEVQWEVGEELKSAQVQGGSHILEIDKGEKLRWRLRNIYPDSSIREWSEWQTVGIIFPSFPTTPQRLSPNGVEFQFYKSDNWSVDLSWESSFTSEVEVRLPDGKTESLTSPLQELKYVPTLAGDYQWRIQGRDEFGRRSSWSEWVSFSVKDLSSERIPGAQRIQIERPNQSVEFSWDGEKTETLFEISKDPKFEEGVLLRKVNAASAMVNIPEPGIYYWRSRRYLPDGKIEVNEPVKVIIEPNEAPSKPRPLPEMEVPLEWKSVRNGFLDFFISSAYADDLEGRVKINLPAHDNAKTYIVRILSSEGKTLLTRELPTQEFRWEGATPGEYLWQYAIKDFWGRQSEFSDASKLVIKSPEVKRALLIRPIRAEKVSGDSIEFKWKIPSGVEKFSFEVSAENDFEKLLFKRDLDSKTSSLNLEGAILPQDGLYYWRVRSYFPDGRMKPSSTGRFTTESREVEAPIITPTKTFPRNLLGLLWTPSFDSYSFQDGAKEGEIDGQNLLSGEVYGLGLREKNFFGGTLRYGRGKVFSGEDYSSAQLKISGGKIFALKDFKIGAGLSAGYLRGNSYSIESNKVRADSFGALQYGPAVIGIYHLQSDQSILASGSYHFGDVSEIEGSIDYLYQWKGHYLQGGVGLLKRSVDTNSGEQTSLSLRLGVAKPF